MSPTFELLDTSDPRVCWELLRDGQHIKEIPGFREALVELATDGWPLAHIGLMFGVTRERVRQWYRDLGLRSSSRGMLKTPARRIWSWEHQRFIPIDIKEYKSRQNHRDRRTAHRFSPEKWRARQEELATRLAALAKTLGRVPTTEDITRAWGCSFHGVLARGWPDRWGSYRDRMQQWYAMAGLEALGPGKGRIRGDRTTHNPYDIRRVRFLHSCGVIPMAIAGTLGHPIDYVYRWIHGSHYKNKQFQWLPELPRHAS